MTLTLKNNQQMNLGDIRSVQVRKELAISEAGRMYVRGWNVVALLAGDRERVLARRPPAARHQAVAFCSMINHMTIFTTEN